jgi:outer membrane immunogenic protein
MNRRFSFGSAVACLFVGSIAAHAADLTSPASPSMTYKASPAVPFSWTGFYIGVNGGYAGGTSGWSDHGIAQIKAEKAFILLANSRSAFVFI